MTMHAQLNRYAAALLALAGLGLMAGSCGEDQLFSVGTVTDEFAQNAAASTDVLWVVDNSASMSEEQAGLGAAFQSFIDHLITSQVIYHIGVVSTDTVEGGALHQPSGVPFIEPTTPDAAGAFLQNVAVGIGGARNERAFETAALALGVGQGWSPGQPPLIPTGNIGFLRDDASLFIIMVSDEDDKSYGGVGYYQRLFDSYHGPGFESRVSVSAIVGPPGVGCVVTGGTAAAPGDRYADLAQGTGGIVASICDDFATSLTDLSITAARLVTTFTLGQLPVQAGAPNNCDGEIEAFCVRVNNTVVLSDGGANWSYDLPNNAVVFASAAVPPPQATITIEYRPSL